MTATRAPSAAPPWALTLWVDDHSVYAELPLSQSSPGQPCSYITRFSLSDAGLHKALNLLRECHREIGRSAEYKLPEKPLTGHVARRGSSKPAKPEGDREHVRSILKRAGILR